MPPAAKQKPQRRWLRLLFRVTIVLALVIGWSMGWHRVAELVDEEIDQFLLETGRRGEPVACPDHRIEGFPFSLVLTCDSLAATPDGAGPRLRAGKVRASFHIYRPNAVSVHLAGPLLLEEADGIALTANWRELDAQVSFNLDGPRQLSARSDGFSLRRDDAAIAADIGHLDFSISRAVAPHHTDPFDIRLTASEFMLAAAGSSLLPEFSLSSDLRLDRLPPVHAPHFDLVADLRANGLSGEFRQAVFTPKAGGRITLSGPFEIARDGLLTTRIDVTTADFEALAGFIETLLRDRPDAIDQLRQATAILSAVGFGGPGASSLTLAVERGSLRAGIVPLGDIPPLF